MSSCHHVIMLTFWKTYLTNCFKIIKSSTAFRKARIVVPKGIYELREHYGQGFRVFYAKVGKKVVLLLAGSTKKDQNKAIAKATEYLADYERREKL